MSSCCGQGMTNLMSQFKTSTQTFTSQSVTGQSLKPHPHSSFQTTTQTTTQTMPQSFSSNFTRGGFMKFSRPTQQ